MAFKLNDKRYEEIKVKVVEVFEKLEIKCIPISAFEVATKMGIVTIPYSAMNEKKEIFLKYNEDGFTFYNADTKKTVIYYNDEKQYGRINNTIMHECGHIILEHTECSELAEAEANFFAKFALAPPALIHKLGLENACEISDKFDISFKAACYAWSYYNKWLQYGNRKYTPYEIKLLNLFEKAN